MVTGCGCTDPVVLGHQSPCEDELGPRYAGEVLTDPTRAAGQYQVEYDSSNRRPVSKCNLSDYDAFCYTHGLYHERP